MNPATRVTAMIPAHDVERAIRWYSEKLGFRPDRQDEYGATYAFNGVSAFLYKSDFAGSAEHTLLSFDSADLLADMAEMRSRGVVFLDYDLPDSRPRTAWPTSARSRTPGPGTLRATSSASSRECRR